MPSALLIALLLAQPQEYTPEITHLDNGLQVVLLEDHTLPLASVQLWYRAGSGDDDPNLPGLCHVARTLLEHRSDAPRRLRAAGARAQGHTLRDACGFTAVLLATATPLARVLEIAAERMQSRPADQAEIERALTCAARPDSSNGQPNPQHLLLAAAFPHHPYQHPPEYVTEAANDLSTDQLNAFMSQWFVPSNAVLLVIGDIQPPTVLDLVRRHFAALPWVQPPRRADLPRVEPAQVHLAATAANRPGLDVAWVTPAAGDDENAAIAVLMHRLCNPVDGPLYHRLADAGCPPPRWHHDSWREAGLLVLSVDLDHGAPDAASSPTDIERIVAEELAVAEKTTPTEVEHNRARALAARQVRSSRRTFAARALDWGESELVAGDLMLASAPGPRIAALRVRDVQQAAGYLRAARTVFLPRMAADPAAVRRMEPPRLRDCGAPESPAAVAPPEGLPTPPPPRSGGTCATRQLTRDIRLTVQSLPGHKEAEVRTWLHPGYRIALALRALMAVGSTQHPVEALRDYLSYHGLDMFPVSECWRAGLRSRGPAAAVPQMIELQANLLCCPNRSPTACAAAALAAHPLQRWIDESGPDLPRELYVPPGFIGWIVGDRPCTDGAVLQRTLARLHTPRPIEIVITGDVDPEEVCDFAEHVWSGHRAPL